MSVGELNDVQPAEPRSRRPDAAMIMRALLLLLWIAILVLGALTGQRQAGLGDLTSAIRSGEITEVTISGEGFTDGGHGFTSQDVVWRSGWTGAWLERVTPIHLRIEDPTGETDDAWMDQGNDLTWGAPKQTTLTGVRDAGAYLQSLDPGLVVHRAEFTYDYAEFGSWRGPTALQPMVAGAFLLTLVFLINGPAPWRATRWAWFWLFITVPLIAMPAYVVLGGPLPGRTERPAGRGLTGGWAFIIMLVVRGGG